MSQNWIKQGQIYPTRSQVPTVYPIDDKIWRIYFSDRASPNRSFIRYIDVEAGNPKKIIYEHKSSVLPWGPLGSFDYAGIMPSWIFTEPDGTVRLYYIGWSQRQDVPYHNGIGLAISKDQGRSFEKFSQGPILADGCDETYFTGTSCVLRDSLGYKMYYLSCTEWVPGTPAEPRYHLKSRESNNGIHWTNPQICIDYKNSAEGGICRASVLGNQMWYCYRQLENYRKDSSKSYRIGYASLNEGQWIRKDEEVNLPLSDSGWDSQMICYPHVIQHQGIYYLFYNGNNFGESGLGYAVLD